MHAAAELGRNPVSKHQIQPKCGDEQVDAGWDCRIRLARSNSQARTSRTGKYKCSFSLFRCDQVQDWQSVIYVTIHTYQVPGDILILNSPPCAQKIK